MTQANNPVIVDLESALIRTNITIESCLLYLKKYPLGLFKLLGWYLRGILVLKEKISAVVIPNPELLPYNKAVLDYLVNAHEEGKEIYLVSSADQRAVDMVSKHLNIFSGAIGSDNNRNLTGQAKLEAINEKVGNKNFEYIGYSKGDDLIVENANAVVICTNKTGKNNHLKSKRNSKEKKEVNCDNVGGLKYWIKTLRIYQWSKNTLLFLALLMSHRMLEADLLLKSTFAFLAFSLIASSVYILNDLFDLEDDRQHPTKKERPLASGNISVSGGLLIVPLLIIGGFTISISQLPKLHTLVLLLYLLATTGYSLYLKEVLFVDVILLGLLYTLRVLAGGFATGVEVSSWLLGFSGFFFLSLAFMKRYTDLILFKKNNQEELFGRGYSLNDSEFVIKAGIASAFVSLLILALYITSDQVLLLYNQPALLWLTIPLILYWLMNMWYNTNKGKMSDDPIIFAIKDKASYIVFILVLVIIISATIL